MSQQTSSASSNTQQRRHEPVKGKSTPQLRAIRKELLLLRADVERTEFMRARAELHQRFEHFGWLKMLVSGKKRKGSSAGAGAGRSINEILSDWVGLHPLVGSLGSMLIAKLFRRRVAALTKPILKWGGLGVAAWAVIRMWSRIANEDRQSDAHEPSEAGDAS
jgi:hypothetical protein